MQGQKRRKKASALWSDALQERVMAAVLQVLDVDLARLWKASLPEEEFVNLFSSLSTVIAEDPAAMKYGH